MHTAETTKLQCSQQASLRALLKSKRYKALADSIFTVVVGLSFASVHGAHARQQEHMAQRHEQAVCGTPNCMSTWHIQCYEKTSATRLLVESCARVPKQAHLSECCLGAALCPCRYIPARI